MQIIRPIIFFDIESTGIDTEKDRIVELCVIKCFYPDTNREIKTYRINPGIPIPASATEIHGISDEDVKDAPLFKQLAKSLLEYIKDCDLGGYNSNHFDIPMLYAEFNRAGVLWDYKGVDFIDPGVIFKRKEERTLSAAMRFYCGEELEGAHGSEADTLATIKVFEAMVNKYDDLPDNIKELALYCNYDKKRLDLAGKFTLAEDGKTILLNFGKNKGLPAKDDWGFLNWMVNKASFPPDTTAIAIALMQNDFTDDGQKLPF